MDEGPGEDEEEGWVLLVALEEEGHGEEGVEWGAVECCCWWCESWSIIEEASGLMLMFPLAAPLLSAWRFLAIFVNLLMMRALSTPRIRMGPTRRRISLTIR